MKATLKDFFKYDIRINYLRRTPIFLKMVKEHLLDVSIKKTIMYSLIILGNLVLIGNPLNLVVSIPEFVYVFYLLIKKRLDRAIFYHIVFVITSVSATNAMGLSDSPMTIYSYARLRLVGPVGASYVLAILILLLSLSSNIQLPKKTMFYKLFHGLLILAILGFSIGLLGFLLDRRYSMEGVLNYGVYIFIVLINMFALLLNYKDTIVKLCYDNVIPLLSASVYASAIAYYLLHVSTSYGGLDNIILKADLSYYAAILLLAFFSVQKRIIVAIPFLVLLLMSFNSSGGKEIVIIGLAAVFFLLMVFGDKTEKSKKVLFYYRVVAIMLIFVISFGILRSSSDSLFSMKLVQFTSMFSSDISDVTASPYIRMATTLNIIQGYLQDPYLIPFGSGYGGYFIDHLNMFDGMDLENGGFSHADVSSGYFHTAHDTFAAVPLLNGVLGFGIIMKLSINYIKKIKYNFCAFAAIPWLLLTFYFNSQLALTGVFFLFAAEYNIEKQHSDER